MDNFLKRLENNDIIGALNEVVQELAKEHWSTDKCPPEFWVSLNNEDTNNQLIMITVNHLNYKFTKILFPRPGTYYGYSSLLDQMIDLYNKTM